MFMTRTHTHTHASPPPPPIQVTVVTNKSDLVSHTETRARSASLKGEKTEWKWVEPDTLTDAQKKALK